MSPDQVFAIVMAAIVASAWVLPRMFRSPVGEALARRLGGPAGDAARTRDLDQLRGRMAELEERLDFTERMLLQKQEQARLGQEGSGQ